MDWRLLLSRIEHPPPKRKAVRSNRVKRATREIPYFAVSLFLFHVKQDRAEMRECGGFVDISR